MSQKSYFKFLAFLGLFFIPLRSLLAIAPHKTGFTDSVGAPYADGWNAYTIGLVCLAPVLIWYGLKLIFGFIKLNSAQKSTRYDQ